MSSKKFKKGQFFIITAVLIVSVLFSAARVFIEYSNFDMEQVRRFGVGYTMHNLEDEFSEAMTFRKYSTIPSTQEKELKEYVEGWAFQRGYVITVNLTTCDIIDLKSLYFDLEKQVC